MVDTTISPYFDDFSQDKNFHKVLFKPRRAVQVRELNQIQSILQNQVSSFGNHVFQNGSMVIPGEINYNLQYEYVTVTGIAYSSIVEILETNDVKIVGQTSDISANVVQHLGNTTTDPITFYVLYSSGSESVQQRFAVGETLQLTTMLGVDFGTCVVNSVGQGSVLTVEAGIFYINGNFIRTDNQRVILSKYDSVPSVVAGFRLNEEIVEWTDDNSLLDNSSGSTNFNAIGADRLKLSLDLEVFDSSSTFDKNNFIELIRFENGVLQSKVQKTDYNVLEETLARRTYDESGDYTVDPFNIRIREHLNTNQNGGLYDAPTGDASKFLVGVEPGKAYVRGYEVENIATRYIEVDKARDTLRTNNSTFSLPVGSYIVLSDTNIIPKSNSFQEISFYSGLPASPGSIPAGTVLGTARVRYSEYDFANSEAIVYIFDIKNASGVKDTSFIGNAASVYAAGSPAFSGVLESDIVDSINYEMFYRLPVQNVKSLLNNGISDTTLTITRQYEAAADTNGDVILTAGTDESFAIPSADGSVASYTGVDTNEYIVNIAPISSLGGVPVGKTLTINFGANAASRNITINVQVVKETASHKTKALSSHTVSLTPGAMVNNRFYLGKADAVALTSVIEDGVNRTHSYKLVKNVSPEVYGQSYIELKAGEAAPTEDTEIQFTYFIHGTGDFFSVDSYASIPYDDIPKETYNNQEIRLSDVIDFRSRYNDANTGFTGTGASIVECPSPASLMRCDIEFYLPRMDKVFVTSKGDFNVIKGVSSIDPKEPQTPDNSMVLYKLFVPAYTQDVKDIVVSYVNNKRYTMRDIGNLEERISNIEYYTTLSLLETETQAIQIIDSGTGLNRFKNGFITDNFIDHSVGLFTSEDYKCSISTIDGELRPEIGMDQIPFVFDEANSSGVVLTGSLVTLPYTEQVFISQPLASDKVNVNPYAVYFWSGTVNLVPSSDTWFDTVYTEPEVTNVTVNRRNITQFWNSWRNNWAGVEISTSRNGNRITTTTVSNRVVADRVVDESVIPFMRSRTINFSASGMLPLSRVYAYFDNINVSAYCTQTGKSIGQPLITDADGKISGTFKIPNDNNLRFRTGTKVFTLIDNVDGDKNDSLSYGDASYSAQGTLITRTQSIVSTRNVTTRLRNEDPLAQSFLIEKTNGVYLTSIDVFFARKDDVTPVTIEIRNMVNGYPGQQVVPYSRKSLNASEITVSEDASIATKFTFDSPVYLLDGQEYCFVLMSNSNNYEVYIATLGQKQIGSNTYISKQPFAGVLFKSQNNLTWTADQQSDMKFTIHSASFVSNVQGNAVFRNGFTDIINLEQNPLMATSGSGSIIVTLKNHGCVAGSVVQISGVDVGPGIDVAFINGEHEVTDVIDSDRFEIVVGANSTLTGAFGGSGVLCSKNIIANTIYPIVEELLFDNTNVDWTFRGVSGKSLDGSEVAYVSQPEIFITPNDNNNLQIPYIISSEVDEASYGAVTANMTARMLSFLDNISPAIDINRLGLICISNRVNNPTVLNETGSNGNAEAKYITSVAGLKSAANSLKVYVDVNKPSESSVVLMYRTGNSVEEVNSIDWSVLPNISSITSTDRDQFIEFEYGVDNIPSFSFYQFKIVMLSSSSSNVPRVKRFRGIALTV